MASTKPACGCLSEARLLILIHLWNRTQHGYGMMQDVKKLGNSKIRLTNGTLYGALRELKAGGLIDFEDSQPQTPSKRRTQPYNLTEVGRVTLREEFAKLRWLVKLGDECGI